MSQAYRIRNEVEVLAPDSCMPDQPVLVQCRGKYFHLRGDAKQIILLLQKSPATLPIIETALRIGQSRPEDTRRIPLVLERMSSLGLLDPQPGLGESAPKPAKSRETQLMLTLPLLRPHHLTWLTRPLSRIVAPGLLAALLPLLLLLHIWAWITILHPVVGSLGALSATVHKLSPMWFWLLALGNYGGLFLHELGHASACIRCGAKHGPIGLCLYWILPGFYTEVNEAWRLPSHKRLVVDCGGIFFSLICASAALLLYLLTSNTVFALLCAIYDVTVLINLVPFIRMDGYWMISDGLGIPNMMRANRELSQWLLLRVVGIPAAKPRILAISVWRKRTYFLYYFAFLLFTLNFIWQTCSWYLPQFEHISAAALAALRASVHDHALLAGAKNVFKLFLAALPAVGLFLYFGRAIKRSVGWAINVLAEQRS
jgi:hypothetical protein